MKTVQSLALFVALLLCAGPSPAQDTMRIGTREAPPFAMKDADGAWEGISIDLAQALGQELGIDIVLVETSLEGMVDDVAAGRLDASIAAMTVTMDRERRVDFSQPYYHSGLGVAVSKSRGSFFRPVIDALTSPDFLATGGLLIGLLLFVGGLIWVVERKANPEDFEREPARGLFSGFWWAAVTMTTVGYGDKAPITVAGRLLATVWMFAALILMALIIAQFTATVTHDRLNRGVTDTAQLAQVKVGNVTDSASLEPLRTLGARPTGYASVGEGLEALRQGDIEAFVHDEPILRWFVGSMEGVEVAPVHFAPQNYAIILPEEAPRVEDINQTLLGFLRTNAWSLITERYLGKNQ